MMKEKIVRNNTRPECGTLFTEIVGVYSPHKAVAVLADTSDYMTGGTVRQFQAAFHSFVQDICADPKISEETDLSVITFSEVPESVKGWMPARAWKEEELNLKTGGERNIKAAAGFAIQELQKQARRYTLVGIQQKIPYILMVTSLNEKELQKLGRSIVRKMHGCEFRMGILSPDPADRASRVVLYNGKDLVKIKASSYKDFFEFFALVIQDSFGDNQLKSGW
ncbi:MAG: hypothetical protein LUF27_11840 [Lachnospiraceae bacterium]|nr:hypothetical protein [Lachnospiraceae bacterium]